MWKTYVQVEFSRTDGRSFETVIAELGGDALVEEAREMAKELVKSSATDYVIVSLQQRDGAKVGKTKVARWTRRSQEWTTELKGI